MFGDAAKVVAALPNIAAAVKQDANLIIQKVAAAQLVVDSPSTTNGSGMATTDYMPVATVER